MKEIGLHSEKKSILVVINMTNEGFMGGLYTMFDWLLKLVYLNVLWFLLMTLGLGIFGISPATIAMFTVTRKWIMGDADIPVFKTFWKTYKTEFIKGNMLGFLFTVVGFILYVDLMFVFTIEHSFADYLLFPLIMMSLVYVLILLYVLPVYVHYDIKIIKAIKNTFYIMVINPLASVLMLLSIITMFFLNVSLPALIPFLSVSVISWIIMFLAKDRKSVV